MKLIILICVLFFSYTLFFGQVSGYVYTSLDNKRDNVIPAKIHLDNNEDEIFCSDQDHKYCLRRLSNKKDIGVFERTGYNTFKDSPIWRSERYLPILNANLFVLDFKEIKTMGGIISGFNDQTLWNETYILKGNLIFAGKFFLNMYLNMLRAREIFQFPGRFYSVNWFKNQGLGQIQNRFNPINYYHEAIINNDTGELLVRVVPVLNLFFNELFNNPDLNYTIWSSGSGHGRLLEETGTYKSYLESEFNLSLSNYIASDEDIFPNKTKPIIVSNNGEFALIDGDSHKISDLANIAQTICDLAEEEGMEDCYSETEEELKKRYVQLSDKVVNLASMFSQRDNNGNEVPVGIKTTTNGTIQLIPDDQNKYKTEEIALRCLSGGLGGYHRLLTQDDYGSLRMESADENEVFTIKYDGIHCAFPKTGSNNLGLEKTLIQYDKLPINNNEIRYLLSPDGNVITIKDANKIRVIHKNNFNGNFSTSPAIQEFEIILP
jgi:hypothetical protein